MTRIPFLFVTVGMAASVAFVASAAEKARSAPVSEKSAVCVAPLSNNTGEAQYEPLAEALTDVLSVALSQREDVKVVERTELRKVLDEQKLAVSALADPATAVRIGKLLNADYILVGGVSKPKDDLRIHVQAYEIATARLLTSAESRGTAADMIPAVNDLTTKLGKGLQKRLEPIDPKDVDKNPNASLHFMRGLGFYYAGNYDNAVVEFMRTQDLDAASDKAGLWMASCFIKNGEFKHALIELEALLRKFPKSPLRQEAQKRIAECKRHAATQAASAPAKTDDNKRETTR